MDPGNRENGAQTLEAWRALQGISYEDLGERLGLRGRVSAWRYCLPHEHPEFRIPAKDVMTRIWVLTRGLVAPNSFYHLPALAEAA